MDQTILSNLLNLIITFDHYGISGHPNHISTYQGVIYYMQKQLNQTKIYLGHEYTLNNSIFCNKFDKNNSQLKIKIADIKKKLDKGMPTVPSTIKEELDCNIFLRAKNLKEFSKLRDLKDNF